MLKAKRRLAVEVMTVIVMGTATFLALHVERDPASAPSSAHAAATQGHSLR